MRKFIKVVLISLSSVLGVILLLLGVAMWFIFTPARITPIVNSQINNFISCDGVIGKTNLTFFKTFPQFGIDIEGVTLLNNIDDSHSDTLLDIKRLNASIDIKAFLKRNEIILKDIKLVDGTINAFTNSAGRSNFDIIPSTDTSESNSSSTASNIIDVDDIRLENIDLSYIDAISGIKATIDNFTTTIKGSITDDQIAGAIDRMTGSVQFEYYDHINHSQTIASLSNLSITGSGSMIGGDICCDLKLSTSEADLISDGEQYLKDAKLNIGAILDASTLTQTANAKRLEISVNSLPITIKGLVSNDAATNSIDTDISYDFKSWSFEELQKLIPPSLSHFLAGIDLSGELSSQGSIKGIYSSDKMPVVRGNVLLNKTTLSYPEALPLPLNGIEGDFDFSSDLTDENTYITINKFIANSDKSRISVTGKADKLFSDIRSDISAKLNVSLAELSEIIPEDANMSAKGTLTGDIKAGFTLAQLTNMELDKIKTSGTIALKGADITYDTLMLKSGKELEVKFALPNPNSSPKGRNRSFAWATVKSDALAASMGESSSATFNNLSLSLETSDLRDTTHIPALSLRFEAGDLSTSMDSISLSAKSPSATISLDSKSRRSDNPRFGITYKSSCVVADLGGDGKFKGDSIDIKTTVTYNEKEDNLFLKLMPRGHMMLKNAVASIPGIPSPVEITSMKMDFNPREFKIDRAEVIFDRSDFNLSGTLKNITPHFRSGELLSGNFTFTSDFTDLNYIMAISSGLGYSDEGKNSENKPTVNAESSQDNTESAGVESSISGPYMVPKNINLNLYADIKQAAYANQIITNINGGVSIVDGVMLLNGLSLGAPAAKMLVTAKYATPRRNHLHLGFDLHMIKIEIADLVNILPDLETIMPMLTSFSGQAEFHAAGEGYLDSLYRFKISTLRGAASLRGNDLVVMDNETFRSIAKKLRFSKKTGNKIDSIAAEFTLFRNEIDVYPFLVSIDKYQAVIGGRHDINMNFRYNVSLVKSPLPLRLSADIYGNLEKQNFKLAKNRYKKYYKPTYRKVVEGEQMKIRNYIHEQLKKNMILDEDENEGEVNETNTNNPSLNNSQSSLK